MTVLMSPELLELLGACGGPGQTLRRYYPVSEYPDGVPVTREICAERHDVFDWSWAVEVMLTYDAQQAYRRRVDELVNETNTADELKRIRHERGLARVNWQREFNEEHDEPSYNSSPESRDAWMEFTRRYDEQRQLINQVKAQVYAVAFADMMAEPKNHSDRLVRGLQGVQERIELNERRELDEAKRNVAAIERRLKEAQTSIEQLTEQLPAAQQRVVEAAAQFANRSVTRAEARVTSAQSQLDEARRAADEATAALEATRAADSDVDDAVDPDDVDESIATESTDEPTDEPTERASSGSPTGARVGS